jgi:glycosyltransferase involved in cell wall biosynthesis
VTAAATRDALPLRVAHLTTVDSTLWYLLRPQLRAVVDHGGEAVGISAAGPHVGALAHDGVVHVPLRSSTRGWNVVADVRAATELWRILRRERYDVLHTHNPKPGIYGRIAGRMAGIPIVVNTNHGLYFSDGARARRLAVLVLEWLAARFSDAELVQNPEDLALLTRWRVTPRHRTTLLGNGVDLGRFRPANGDGSASGAERSAARAALGARPDHLVVGMVGRLVAEKGYPELFEAARLLGPRYLVVAIGPEDPAKADALSRAQLDAAVRDGVRLLGQRDDVDLLYRGMDVFVLPSRREGFPRAAMEAAASGVPVVATDVRGCRQVVDHGVTGLLVPVASPRRLADAIRWLGEDEARRHEMGAAGARRARVDFDELRVIDLVIDTYRSVAARRGIDRRLSSSPGRTAGG